MLSLKSLFSISFDGETKLLFIYEKGKLNEM